ncbi:glycosyltransferase [Halobaculum sp. WSA2]|uniref:Glycosyltransferase n=1 Tax=Halobaculum saliterrae TaxID=2073113 RepID=A0A6B0T5S4_9EURY|nr:glycosyltransferase [Halobaculum saliterrae]MXR41849.1 glycosyltransferase [Halobaculum saliterrae]
MEADQHTVFIFSTHDISTVQGTTEAYYVSRSFGELFDTHVIGPSSTRIVGTTSHSYSASGILGVLWMNIILLPRWVWLACRTRPDIVYAYRNVILPPIFLKILFGSRVVCDLQVHPVEQPKEFNKNTITNKIFLTSSWLGHKLLLGFSDITITLSEPLCQSIAESFGISEDEIYIVPLGVDPDVFVPQTKENKDNFTIVYVGSIKAHRGIEFVFKGLNQLSKQTQERINVELFGPVVEDYAAEIEELANVGAYSVTWHGLIPHEDVPYKVGNCDCAVSPLPPHEGFNVSSPAKIYEYLALGLPIIATRITPHQRILEHEHDALFVEPDDTQEMSEAIERLISNERLRSELGMNAREKGIENSWERRIQSILEVVSDGTKVDIPN